MQTVRLGDLPEGASQAALDPGRILYSAEVDDQRYPFVLDPRSGEVGQNFPDGRSGALEPRPARWVLHQPVQPHDGHARGAHQFADLGGWTSGHHGDEPVRRCEAGECFGGAVHEPGQLRPGNDLSEGPVEVEHEAARGNLPEPLEGPAPAHRRARVGRPGCARPRTPRPAPRPPGGRCWTTALPGPASESPW